MSKDDREYPPLTCYVVSYDDGKQLTVSMAHGVTLEQARGHFVGQRFEITEDTFHTAVAVEEAPLPLEDEDKTAILNLCGTEGNVQKGVLYLHMRFDDITDARALAAVESVRNEFLSKGQ